MALESLLLSEDADLVRVIHPMLGKLDIDVEVCHETRSAAKILMAEKFDAVIVDCDDLQGGLEILRNLRNMPSNKSAVSFAILNGKSTTTQEAFNMGANFVLQKPISSLNASRCFHAALNLMLNERRRYFREPVKLLVSVTHKGKVFGATSTNISESGIALILHQALPQGAQLRLQFTLPEMNGRIETDAELVWGVKDRAGFRFCNVSKDSREKLQAWLDSRPKASRTSLHGAF